MKVSLNKKQIGIIVGVGIISVLLFIAISSKEVEEELIQKNDTTVDESGVYLSSSIIAPGKTSWQNGDFKVNVIDSSLLSELAEYIPGQQGCEYMIYDVATKGFVSDFRECGVSSLVVPVGKGKPCSSSYSHNSFDGRCIVSTKAVGIGNVESRWGAFSFFVDTTAPIIESIASPSRLFPGEEYTFQTTMVENGQIFGCWLWVGEEGIKDPPIMNPVPCQYGEECTLEMQYTFEDPGEYSIGFGCSDLAGNVGFGEGTVVEVFQNSAPTIGSCKVLPSTGVVGESFQFSVEAGDIDEDTLFYKWDFGDENSQYIKSPTHLYNRVGVYRPSVIVQDPSGVQVVCQTAWVIVEEE